MPERVKTVIHLTFFDEPDKRMEANHWQYWYNLQANPNQKAFDIGMQNTKGVCAIYVCAPWLLVLLDRKNCENIHGKPVDLAYNAASFVWCPEMGAKVWVTKESSEYLAVTGIHSFSWYMIPTACVHVITATDVQVCLFHAWTCVSHMFRLCFASTASAQSSPPKREWRAFLFTLSQIHMKILTQNQLSRYTGLTAKSRYLETRLYNILHVHVHVILSLR